MTAAQPQGTPATLPQIEDERRAILLALAVGSQSFAALKRGRHRGAAKQAVRRLYHEGFLEPHPRKPNIARITRAGREEVASWR